MNSKFLLAENPIAEDGKEYILHSEEPRFLAEIIESDLGYKFEIVQEFDKIEENEKEEIQLLMLDWWNDYLDWEESLIE